ncbi:DNA cytosine methyltransferase, partial [Limosilactobacillus reuteri]
LMLTDSGEIRKLTPHETFMLQGYPSSFKLPDDEANGQLYKQAGNSVVVPVIHRIAENIIKVISNQEGQGSKAPCGRYALIYTDMDSKYEGASYMVNRSDDTEMLKQSISGSTLLTDAEYLKLVQKKKRAIFYLIEDTE